jgi:hypothetical protein
MTHKVMVWVGSLVIIAAGAFCFLSLLKYRSHLEAANPRFLLVDGATFLSLPIAIGAIVLWVYFNKK